MSTPSSLTPGDLLIRYDTEERQWHATKILLIDEWPDDLSTAHCLIYEPTADKPTLESMAQAEVWIGHAPIAASSYLSGDYERLGNIPPTPDDLLGFTEYLKLTDFPRYAAFTGQDIKDITSRANDHYQRGYALAKEGQPEAAIAEYEQAYALFPFFYEAIDNRAFIHMDYGHFQEALQGFEHSLQVHPEGVAAFFSKGECLTRLGQLEAAEALFTEGVTRFPEKSETFTKYLGIVRSLRQKYPSQG